ncbi:MAG TPA: LysE family translocator [Tepidisphaeraceae bacterium]|jgi:threonine/homoserine/homoserine lactone efflux protein|nr:LysE family translocator [Tepidisphaeraceae bacterium]
MDFPSRPYFIAFLAASFVLAVTPGPGVLYIVTRSLAQGRRAGLASVAGVAFGNLSNAIAAAVGLGAWFAISSVAFTVVKYAGAAYLVYLGLSMLLSKENRIDVSRPEALSVRRIFRNGFFVALLNPKTTIFFAAFFPQFMGSRHGSIATYISLGAIFVAIAATTDTLYALSAGLLAPTLNETRSLRRIGRGISASVFLGLGLYSAFSGPKRAQ